MQRFRKLSVNFALGLALVGLGGAASFHSQNIPSAVMRSPSVKGEAVYDPYRKIVLKAGDGVSAKAQFLWDVEGTGTVEVAEAGEVLYVWAEPGSYKVTLTSVDFEAKKIERARFTFKVSGKKPDPGPGPNPNPGPAPDPDDGTIETGPCWVVVIEETEEAVAERGKILRDTNLQKYVKAKGWKFLLRDKDAVDANGQTPADVRPYVERAKGKTLPQMYVVNKDGRVRFEGAMPKTAADVLAALKKIGG